MQIRGGCHGGNVSFELTWKPDPPEIAARACTCTFGTKHGGVISVHAVVDADTFEGVASSLLRPAAATFDGDSEADRLARRKRGWIAAVTFHEPERSSRA